MSIPSIEDKALRVGEEVFDTSVCCTGEQLSRILEALAPQLGELLWYAADIETSSGGGEWPIQKSQTLVAVGSSAEAIEKSRRTVQFLSGVFVAALADVDLTSSVWRTDDKPFRDLQGATIEIRAFDTSYFEIYSVSESLIEVVADSLGGTMLARSPAE